MKTKRISFVLVTVLVLALQVPARAAGYVAHEWGTFTSVQGSDGELIAWNPFTAPELPAFVHLLNHPMTNAQPGVPRFGWGKSLAGAWLQRMETPVIYFYTDAPMRVDATVDFPEGLVTEWFPRVESFGPRAAVKRSFVRWAGAEIRPSGPDAGRTLPVEKSGSHYYAARETDSALVTVPPPFPTGQPETDKFLFYRGVGNFKAPLHVRFDGDKLVLLNRGGDELPHLFVLEVRGGTARAMKVPALGGGADVAVALPGNTGFRSLTEVRAELSVAMEAALVESGLYRREAAAMVKTWADSWFTENGTRVLYTLPRAWTDRVLPLKLDPAPREVVRVFVGRAEIFTPEVERVVAFHQGALKEPGARPELMKRLDAMGLGKFANAALIRSRATDVVASALARRDSEFRSLIDCRAKVVMPVNSMLKQPETTLTIPPSAPAPFSMAAGAGFILTNGLQFRLPPSAELQPPSVSLR